MNDADQLDAIFSALANPARRAIVARLAEGGATVNELAAPFAMSLPAISKHIRVLEKARLITRGRDAQFRPCQLNGPALAAVVHWTDQYRHIWDVRFDAMDDVIRKMGDAEDG